MIINNLNTNIYESGKINYESLKPSKKQENEINNEVNNEVLTEREQKIINIKNKIQNNEYPKINLKELSKIIVNDLF